MSLTHWFNTPLGQFVKQAETTLLTAHLQNLFGYHLLLIGAGNTQWLEFSRIPHRLFVPVDKGLPLDSHHQQSGSLIQADAAYLPIATDSVDTVILQHALDFSDDPHQVLREAERVLMPGGRILVCGFNARSLWGLSRVLHFKQAHVPWNGKFQSTSRLKDWLCLLGFEMEFHQKVFFRPPFKSENVLNKLEFMERVCAKVLPFTGGVYLLVAKKKVSNLIPIKPRWQARRNKVSGWVDTAPRSKE